jgi:DeoR family transcriptional regulator of aga operon
MGSQLAARRGAILDLLGQVGHVEISDLEKRFRCSEATIRRDLDSLQAAGYLTRTHGGGIATYDRELPLRAKATEMASQKQRISERAAAMVRPGHSVGLTGGTTTQFLARRLTHIPNLTVVTNAINIALEFVDSAVHVVLSGGTMRANTLETVGPLAEPVLAQIHMDVVFAGVDGISAAAGLTTHSPVEARTNAMFIARADKLVAVADHTKLGRATFAVITTLEALDVLITDDEADARAVKDLEAAGVEVILAGADRGPGTGPRGQRKGASPPTATAVDS